jgi:ABC-2 type transport system ATP-binding protein
VGKFYGDFEAVKNVSFEVREGEVFSIVGPNGAGKTTILKMLVGLVEPSYGKITIAGHDVTKEGSRIRGLLGFLPEESPVYEDMSAADYLKFFAELYKIPGYVAEYRIQELLRLLNFHFLEKKLGDLSKGMKRKIVIARSLINNPKILVYDEPCSGLDPMTSYFIMNFIKRMKRHKTVLLSTHNLYQAESVSDRILILKDGRVIALGTPEELKKKYGKHEYTVTFTMDGLIDTKLRIIKDDSCLRARCSDIEEINLLVQEIVRRGGKILGIESRGTSLEEIFIRAVK